ncbi:MAG: hypothetical protein LBK82_16380 [Planctomycetaceae bacterium]|nr:hypothetical protein [Planctomycetaceae bacterium]
MGYYQKARWVVAPVESALTPKRKAILFAVVPLISSRRVRRRDPLVNSKRSPT